MSTISFQDVGYSVEVRRKAGMKCLGGQITHKQILFEISGIFKPGMNAILGPTGSGKTTLLDVLSDRIDKDGVNGRVLVDGRLPPKNFKFITGYVVQDDVVMGTLTVRESIMFSANLRLPNTMTSLEKEVKVNEVLNELGLNKCADTKIGTEMIRGVSGGERKRVSIGMELVISPSILFLDEPTTGLDASTANSVMSLLQGLSQKGRTVIFSIHQPRFSIFKYFNTLSLLGNGKTVYHGPAEQALDYFDGIGYKCEPHNNPPDFFMDVISDASSSIQEHENLNSDSLNSRSPGDNGICVINIKRTDPSVPVRLFDRYRQSDISHKVSEELVTIEKSYGTEGPNTLKLYTNQFNGGISKNVKITYPTSALAQTMYVSSRTIKNLIRNPQTFVMQIIVNIFFALVVGIIYLQLGTQLESAIQNRLGAFLFIVMNQVFSNLSIVELFIRERHIFVHESASGFYRVSSYFFSKVLCDIIPMRFLPVTIFAPISYFMIGFQCSAEKFFIFYLFLFLTSLAGASLGILISSSVSIFAIANLLIVLSYVLMMLFGGLLVNLETMADWLSWLQYLSIVRYSLNALSINELEDIVLQKTMDNGTIIEYPDVGKNFLKSQGIKYGTSWNLWSNCLALIVMVVVFLLLAYVQLRRMKKLK